MKTLVLSIIILLGSAARAEGHQPLAVNFNQEIDQNNESAQDISKDVDTSMADSSDEQPAKVATAAVKPEQQKATVTNFVDFEIESGVQPGASVSNQPQPADRRFNSVSEPQVAGKDNF
jgi:cation transport regulator ChaB